MSLDDTLRSTVRKGEIIRIVLSDGTIIVGKYQSRSTPSRGPYGFYIHDIPFQEHPLRDHDILPTIILDNDSVKRIERFVGEEIYDRQINP